MKRYTKGRYVGITKTETAFHGILLSETNYPEGLTSNWHYHENPYFTFVLSGGSVEKRNKLSVECAPGQALFYNCREPHRNMNYQPFSRNFNVEFDNNWLNDFGLTPSASHVSSIFRTDNTDLKLLLLKVFREYKQMDSCSEITIQSIGLQLISLIRKERKPGYNLPAWSNTLREILHDCWYRNLSLKELSGVLQIHPVTISKNFPRFFNCTLGEYIRKIKINKSLSMIKKGDQTLTEVAYSCGFADQSHFTRVFKQLTGFLPTQYKAL